MNIEMSKLNSITKYPSIPTWHTLGEKGRLTEERNVSIGGQVVITEKVDGTNCRMIFPSKSVEARVRSMNHGGIHWVIGSRNGLLAAFGDLCADPTLGIVDHLWRLAGKISEEISDDVTTVAYGELFGGKIGPGGNYSSKKELGFRLFDVMKISDGGMEQMAKMDGQALSVNRDAGVTREMMLPEPELLEFANKYDVKMAPRIEGDFLDGNLADTQAWLTQRAKRTGVALDEGANCMAEGVVVRSPDSRVVAKLRHQDYKRTLK